MPNENQILELAAQLAQRYRGVLRLPIAEWAMNWFGITTYSIESITGLDGDKMDYINRGDTYASTVIREGDKYYVSSWGAWAEDDEHEFCAAYEDENDGEKITRCGYCGRWTPVIGEWRDTICESCNRNVSTGERKPTAINTDN